MNYTDVSLNKAMVWQQTINVTNGLEADIDVYTDKKVYLEDEDVTARSIVREEIRL